MMPTSWANFDHREPITNSGLVPVALGVIADQPDIEATPGTVTPVVFDVYLTGTASTATTIDYVVEAGGAGFLGASAFGGTLPSGSVVVQAGSLESQFTIDLPIGALGDLPSENLQVAISSPDGDPVFVATAQDTIDYVGRFRAATGSGTGRSGQPSAVLSTTATIMMLNLGSIQLGNRCRPSSSKSKMPHRRRRISSAAR